MPKENEIKLPSLDELFTTQEERDDAKLKRIYEIPIDKIDPFPDHPFKVKEDEDMDNLVESIKAKGVLTPCMVRKKPDGRYELISGHRRKCACEILGFEKLRCEVVDMSKEEATVIMVESNFQRTTILPSEKAFAYKMRLEAMKRVAGRPAQGNYSPLGNNKKESSSMEMASEVGDSKSQIFRYIRLTELIPELLDIVDEGKMGLRPAVELSYVGNKQQRELLNCIQMEQCTPTHEQARRMRAMYQEGKLTSEAIEAIMLEEKPNQKERIVLHGDRFRNLFPKNLPYSKREEYVAKAMEYYGRYLSRIYRKKWTHFNVKKKKKVYN